jgi:hypothetical protein
MTVLPCVRPPVVVSMTTTPPRIADIEPALRSVLRQTAPPTRLHLYLPRSCARFAGPYVIPPWLARLAATNEVLEITPVSEDYGPATKLLPSLTRYNHPETRLVTVDDDVVLEEHTLEELVAASIDQPRSVLGMMGVTEEGEFAHAEWVNRSGLERRRVTVLGGYRGVLYPRAVWDESIWTDYVGITGEIKPFLSDDHLFAWNLLRREIPCWVIRTQYPRHAENPEDSLACLNLTMLHLSDGISEPSHSRAAASMEALRQYYHRRGWATTIDQPS